MMPIPKSFVPNVILVIVDDLDAKTKLSFFYIWDDLGSSVCNRFFVHFDDFDTRNVGFHLYGLVR